MSRYIPNFNSFSPYLRLLRLQDQYFQVGSALTAAIMLHFPFQLTFVWILATVLFSSSTFIINEVVDNRDADRHSWNPIHVKNISALNPVIIWSLYGILTLLGLVLSFLIGLMWWGLLMHLVGVLYSTPPIRLKARFMLDILSQLSVWWVIPFLAPFSLSSSAVPWGLVLSACVLIWGVYFPYALSDYEADLLARLKNTHVVLGLKNSLLLGLTLVVAGCSIFSVWGYPLKYPWLSVLLPFAFYAVKKYYDWLFLSSQKCLSDLQTYVRLVKPLSQLVIPYLLLIYVSGF